MNFHSFWLSNISLPHKLFARCLEVQLKRANLCYECTFLKALLMNWFPCRVQETVLQSNEWKALNFKHLSTKDNTTFYTKFWRIRKLRRGSDPVLLYLPEQLLLWKWNKIWTLSPVNVHGGWGGVVLYLEAFTLQWYLLLWCWGPLAVDFILSCAAVVAAGSSKGASWKNKQTNQPTKNQNHNKPRGEGMEKDSQNFIQDSFQLVGCAN